MVDLLIADPHLTDNPADNYRWQFFSSLSRYIRQAYEKDSVRVIFLGDLTENKDKHNESVVNHVVRMLGEKFIANNRVTEIVIVPGNHDSIDESRPYFRFLAYLPKIHFVIEPEEKNKELFLPYSRNFEDYLTRAKLINKLKGFKRIFMHQTVVGSITTNKYKMPTGVPLSIFEGCKEVYSGDIHVPQKIGPVIYVGAPYHIYFGENYTGRVLFLDSKGYTEHQIDTPYKLALTTTPTNYKKVLSKVREDDQVSLQVILNQNEISDWFMLKTSLLEYAEKHKFMLAAVELTVSDSGAQIAGEIPERGKSNPVQIAMEYGRQKELDMDYLRLATNIIEEVGK